MLYLNIKPKQIAQRKKTLLSTYIWRRKKILGGQQCKHVGQRRQMVWKRSKEIHRVKLERPTLNRGSGLRHYLSPTYNAVLCSLTRQLINHSHLGSPSPSNPHEGWSSQRPISGPNDYETQRSHVSITTLKDTPTQSFKACNSPPVS